MNPPVPPTVKAFAWQAAYDGLREAATDAVRAYAARTVGRVVDHAAHAEFAALIGASPMGSFRASRLGAPDLLGKPHNELAEWLHWTAARFVDWKTAPTLTAALDAVPIPATRFEIDPMLVGRLPEAGVALARLLADRQPSRRLVVTVGSLEGTGAAGVFNPRRDRSVIVLDVVACDRSGPDLTSAFAHELAHAADPDLCSPDRERFAEHLAPILCASWPVTLDALDTLITATEMAIDRAQVLPEDGWEIIDSLLVFADAPLRRVECRAGSRSLLATEARPCALRNRCGTRATRHLRFSAKGRDRPRHPSALPKSRTHPSKTAVNERK